MNPKKINNPTNDYSNYYQKYQDERGTRTKLNVQLNLFNSPPPSWKLNQPCRVCGNQEAIELPSGNETHHSKLVCTGCQIYIQWVSRRNSKLY